MDGYGKDEPAICGTLGRGTMDQIGTCGALAGVPLAANSVGEVKEGGGCDTRSRIHVDCGIGGELSVASGTV